MMLFTWQKDIAFFMSKNILCNYMYVVCGSKSAYTIYWYTIIKISRLIIEIKLYT